MAADGVASIGECMLELSGQAGPNWRMGFAGDTFNTLWALHALSGERPATYVSAFGDDPFSQGQISFFAENGIGIGASPVIPGARPGLYAITLTGAERAFTYWRSDAAARRLASDPAALAKSLENQALVYFSGITLAILDAAARKTLLAEVAKARAAGSLVAFDPNYRPRLWQSREEAQAAILDALAVADIALPTFPDEQMLFGDSAPQATAERFGKLVGEVVVKNGEEPALIATGGALQPVPAQHVATPVDTTGAGDSFNGGYLAARLAGHAPADAVQRAHRVAAAVVQVRGALAPFEVLRTAFEG
ncbi:MULTISPECIES: sugar kinase [unclassified Mesorhizobium]|uniref:sugar kinase n=1 Tax=unclassified Mesorhizobium TaxID=325217 RepID=UPI0003CEDE3C|nr:MULTISPECIES: sugar kinase [unclassified Mesorhizobium]ESX29775.1 2-dehydro-3-deoxygluconokinase [Mesorhizobium sp. LSHC440B00]ESX35299.1 2-dehydro-3-deoxygluconokinase [Mesorhizobium sp. LSHC432A00]ESX75857.1 2-dehydro-3-deoxygluconokinase [Mesorhizobium sp. LSHC414A00]ESY41782.1 2-dehydro-3-deoxygluconokinase [Mesorhizobium sp. LNJC384A00]ESZ42548.1 2-dehydro-3-deoxygluconokinase [Mesorhizobium sp. L2C066B000]